MRIIFVLAKNVWLFFQIKLGRDEGIKADFSSMIYMNKEENLRTIKKLKTTLGQSFIKKMWKFVTPKDNPHCVYLRMEET